MKVFLSWSGEQSKAAAHAVREWLPLVLNAIHPWMSAADIEAGARWNRKISSELEETRIGILFVTATNIDAPWLLFEAGALAKTLDDSFVCPYLLGVKPSDLPSSPIAQFQAKVASFEGTWDLVRMLNDSLDGDGLSDGHLEKAFEMWWPQLESRLSAIPADSTSAEQPRQLTDVAEDTLDAVRRIERSQDQLAETLAAVAKTMAGNDSTPEVAAGPSGLGRYFQNMGK